MLGGRSGLVRAYSAWALGRLGAQDARQALAKRLTKERDPTARAGLLESLVVLAGERTHFKALLALLGHPDYRVRCFTANSLVGVATSQRLREVEQALRAALERERTVAGREALRENLDVLEG